MSRTLLYYPTFQLPSEQWLKDAVLYWDEVGSIVPQRFERVTATPNLRYLIDEGIYRRFEPDTITGNWELSQEFLRDLKQRLESPEFAVELAKPTSGGHWDIAFEKMTYDVWSLLAEKGLTPSQHFSEAWIKVKKPAAIIYMGLLARYMATSDSHFVQPSTDQAEYEDVVYRCGPTEKSLPGMALALNSLLPRVSPSTELRAVIQFRKERREDLLNFRKTVDDAQTKLSKCESRDDAKLLISQFQEQLELGSATIQRQMQERGIRGLVGTLRTIFSAKSPAWLALAGAGAGVGLGDPLIAVASGVA